MKKIVAFMLTLVMLLSLGTAAFAYTVKPLGVRLTEFTANTVAVLLYSPAQHLAEILADKGPKVEVTVNSLTKDVYGAAAEVGETTTTVLTLTQDTAHKIVTVVKSLIVLASTTGANLLEEIDKLVDSEDLRSVIVQLRNLYERSDEGAAECNKGIDIVCNTLLDYIGGTVKKVMAVTGPSTLDGYWGTVAGENFHRFVVEATAWLTDADTFAAYDSAENEGGDLARLLYHGIRNYFARSDRADEIPD